MAAFCETQSRNCTLLLGACLKSKPGHPSGLKKAVVENSIEQVCLILGGERRPKLNKLWTFSTDDGQVLHIPPLCVAVYHRNLALVQCLLTYGADPNRLGQVCVSSLLACRSSRVSPFLMALEDHPSEGVPFNPDVASALLAAGADINTTAASRIQDEEEEGGTIEYYSGNSPLHNCVGIGIAYPLGLSVFFFLLDNGADMFLKDARGRTPLQKALEMLTNGRGLESDVSEELIRRGGFVTTHEEGDRSDLSFVLISIAKAVSKTPREKLVRRAHLLLDAGYQCSGTDVARFENLDIQDIDPCLGQRMRGLWVYDLKHLCRLKIRERVGKHCKISQQQCKIPGQYCEISGQHCEKVGPQSEKIEPQCEKVRLQSEKVGPQVQHKQENGKWSLDTLSQLPLPSCLVQYVNLMS